MTEEQTGAAKPEESDDDQAQTVGADDAQAGADAAELDAAERADAQPFVATKPGLEHVRPLRPEEYDRERAEKASPLTGDPTADGDQLTPGRE